MAIKDKIENIKDHGFSEPIEKESESTSKIPVSMEAPVPGASLHAGEEIPKAASAASAPSVPPPKAGASDKAQPPPDKMSGGSPSVPPLSKAGDITKQQAGKEAPKALATASALSPVKSSKTGLPNKIPQQTKKEAPKADAKVPDIMSGTATKSTDPFSPSNVQAKDVKKKVEAPEIFHPEYMDDKAIDQYSEPIEIDPKKLKKNKNGLILFPTKALYHMEGHRYKVEVNPDLLDLEAKIRLDGIKAPLNIWKDPDDGKYKVLSGNRRRFIAFRNMVDFVPVIIEQCDRDDAILLMNTANPDRKVSFMERLGAAHDEFEARKRIGIRNSSGKGEEALANEIGQKLGVGARQLQRQMHLLDLIEEMHPMINDGSMSKGVGIDLSYLQPDEQLMIWDGISYELYKMPKPKQAAQLKALSQSGKWTEEEVRNILIPGLDVRPRDPDVVFKSTKIPLIFPEGTTIAEMEEQLISLYKSKEAEQRKNLIEVSKDILAEKEKRVPTKEPPKLPISKEETQKKENAKSKSQLSIVK